MQEYGHYYMEQKTGKSLFNSQLALPTNRLSTSDAVAGKLLHRAGGNGVVIGEKIPEFGHLELNAPGCSLEEPR
jgi:hypothetical protein